MTERLGVINGLRGYAILSVVCYHVFARFTEPGQTTFAWLSFELPVSAVLENGWMGVNIFFVLSGFVLFLPYARGQREMTAGAGTRDFYRRRFRRLMPLYYLGLLLCAVFVYHPQPGSARFFSDAFFMGTATFNFVEDLYYPPYNWVLWSLGLEIWFSVLFPALVRLTRRFGVGRLLAVVVLLSLATRIVGEHRYGDSFNLQLNPLKDSFLGRLDEFVLGMAVCSLYVRRGQLAHPLALLSCGLGALSLYAAAWCYDLVALGSLSRSVVPFLYYPISLGTCLLTYGALSLKSGPARLLFSNPPLQWLGMICYSLYTWHGVLALSLFTEPAHYDLLPMACNLGLILLLATFSYRYVEYGWQRDTRALFRPAP